MAVFFALCCLLISPIMMFMFALLRQLQNLTESSVKVEKEEDLLR